MKISNKNTPIYRLPVGSIRIEELNRKPIYKRFYEYSMTILNKINDNIISKWKELVEDEKLRYDRYIEEAVHGELADTMRGLQK